MKAQRLVRTLNLRFRSMRRMLSCAAASVASGSGASIQGCRRACAADSRALGSNTSSLLIRSLALGGTEIFQVPVKDLGERDKDLIEMVTEKLHEAPAIQGSRSAAAAASLVNGSRISGLLIRSFALGARL